MHEAISKFRLSCKSGVSECYILRTQWTTSSCIQCPYITTIFFRSSHALNSIVTFTKHNKFATNAIQVQNTCTSNASNRRTVHDAWRWNISHSICTLTSFKTNVIRQTTNIVRHGMKNDNKTNRPISMAFHNNSITACPAAATKTAIIIHEGKC